MTEVKISRRGFLVGCSAAIAAMAGSHMGHLVFGQSDVNDEVLVVVFLRGGIDGLNLVPPIGGPDRAFYEAARPNLRVPVSGTGAALELGALGTAQFGFNSLAAPLHELYQDNKLAIVHAAGLRHETRSHFDAMEFMELGTPGAKTIASGWLTRHLQTATNIPSTIIAPSIATGTSNPTALFNSRETIAMSDPGSFAFDGFWRYEDQQRLALRRMYNGDSWLHQAGIDTLDAIDIIESKLPRDSNGRYSYTPGNGAEYPDSSFGRDLETIAQMIKLNLGMRIATVDLGGWDTHENQGAGDANAESFNPFPRRLNDLARGLAAFYQDLDGAGANNHTQRLTVVVMSEFGRRLKENGNAGTDHGHGNVMMVLGGNVNGGLYGTWPGLDKDQNQLFQNEDLAITTDYRTVLTEVLLRRLGNPFIGDVFPGYTEHSSLGVLNGTEIPMRGTLTRDEQVFLPVVRHSRNLGPARAPYPAP